VPRGIPATKTGVGPDGADIYRPVIFITIEIGGQGIGGPAIVDSGADNTLVPAEALLPFGIQFDKLAIGAGGQGAGGDLEARPCQGTIRWGRVELMRSFMVAEPGKGFGAVLLGRADFFKLYVPRFHWYLNPPTFDLDPVAVAPNPTIRPKAAKRKRKR
jgi:hypothetical protein